MFGGSALMAAQERKTNIRVCCRHVRCYSHAKNRIYAQYRNILYSSSALFKNLSRLALLNSLLVHPM